MIKPINDKILIKIEEKFQSTSGLDVSTVEQNLINEQAEVLAVGDEVKKIKKGDIVHFKSWSLDNVEYAQGKVASYIREKEVLGIIK